jgi:hypothetical protein
MTDDERLLFRHMQRVAYGIPSPLKVIEPEPVAVTIRHVEPGPLEHLEPAPPEATLH